MDGLQSLSNFIGLCALLPETSDDTSMLDFVHIDIVNVRNADQRPMPVESSRLSSMI
jgi:hypothetical protein